MAQIEAPIGSHFMLRWTTDPHVDLTNRFRLVDGSDKDFAGRPPHKGASKGKVLALLTITKDGEEYGYRLKVPAPTHAERYQAGGKIVFEYTFVFLARETGEYVFTIAFTADPPTSAAPPTITKEIKIVDGEALNDRRRDMIDLIKKWLPSAVYGAQKIPAGEKSDILAKCGWDKVSPQVWTIPAPSPPGPIETLPKAGQAVWTQTGAVITASGLGQINAAKKSFDNNIVPQRQKAWAALSADDKKLNAKPQGVAIATSCIDVMMALVALWGKDFKCDASTMQTADPAFYVKADDAYKKTPPQEPKPGDILYLVEVASRQTFQHVCILVSRSGDVWETADGGGGGLPEQTATINDKPLTWTVKSASQPSVPSFISVTDNKEKALHGWVDLDRAKNALYNADGSRKAAGQGGATSGTSGSSKEPKPEPRPDPKGRTD